MDRRERSGDLLAGLLALQQTWAGELYVALPGIVQSFDPAKRTCVVQPAINAQLMDEKGGTSWVAMPLLLDCPVIFPGGGDVVITFPLKQGDEVMVLFSDRCIDAWWQSGGIQNQAELRMHDLSDGYCFPGPSSLPRVEAGIDATKATMRSRDGVTLISLDPAGHEVDIITTGAQVSVKPNEVDAVVGGSTIAVKPAEIDLTCFPSSMVLNPSGVTMQTTGASLAVTSGRADITGALYINGSQYLLHKHTGVTSGPSSTGNVV